MSHWNYCYQMTCYRCQNLWSITAFFDVTYLDNQRSIKKMENVRNSSTFADDRSLGMHRFREKRKFSTNCENRYIPLISKYWSGNVNVIIEMYSNCKGPSTYRTFCIDSLERYHSSKYTRGANFVEIFVSESVLHFTINIIKIEMLGKSNDLFAFGDFFTHWRCS